MRKKQYIHAFCIQVLDKPDDFLDHRFPTLCAARKGNYSKKPIYDYFAETESGWNDSFVRTRIIEPDELCQCCETKLAKLIKGTK